MKKNIKHKYDYNAYLKGDNSAAHILEMINPNDKVLEVGAGPGSITKLLVEVLKCKVFAIEIDDDALAKLKNYCEAVFKVDLNSSSWPEQLKGTGVFDVVVAADVLEHLIDPLAAINNMKEMIHEKGHIVVSLPHIGHNAVYASLLNNDFAYSEYGLLDKTHIRFFGIKNIQSLFDSAGLKIIDVVFVLRKPEDTELADKWRKLAPEFRKLLESNKFGHVYQCVIKATPASDLSGSIQIATLNVGTAENSFIRKINRLVKRFFPLSFYQFLRSVYQKIQ